MGLTILKVGKKEFVLVPKREYDMLTRREQDAKDAEIARKAMAKYRAGKLKTIPLEEARAKWGV